MNPPTPATGVDATASGAPASSAPTATFHAFSFVLGLLTALVLVGGTLLFLRRPEPPPIAIQPPPTPAPTATPLPTPTQGPIAVFVSGAVAQPGVYALDAEARVGDALVLAGGLLEEAEGALVNQAERLWDGAQIHVPQRAEEPSALAGLIGSAPAAGVVDGVVDGVVGGVVGSAPEAGRSGAIDRGAGLIDLNLATAIELETLPGIGPSKAAAILANRPYASVDDLMRVPGIGEKTIEQLRGYVIVQ